MMNIELSGYFCFFFKIIIFYLSTLISTDALDITIFIKSLLRTNVLNEVTAAPFLVVFLQLVAEKMTPKMVQL